MMYVLWCVVALQVADVVTTCLALKTGVGTEGNPLITRLMSVLGVVPTLLLIKGLFIGWVVYASPVLVAELPWVLWLLLAVYTGVVANNLRVILK